MKICCTCKQEKSIDEFGLHRGQKDGRSNRCLICSRAHATKWYQSHRGVHQERVKRNVRSIREWYKELKQELSCVQCGEDHPACLDFHHRDPSTKDYAVARMFMLGSKQKILDEIKKCDVLCANCHRKLHHSLSTVL